MNLRPTSIVILGVTGDLTAKKIIPALFNLYAQKLLPENIRIIGFGRREYDQSQFKAYIKDLLLSFDSTENYEDFLGLLHYQHGYFEKQESYLALSESLKNIESSWTESAQRLFYLAVPPEIYSTIFQNLKTSGLGSDEIETKILVEKPFGKDLKTAEELDVQLGTLYQEHQIYRIDHYLVKEMVQNILAFRFSNDMFEKTWNNQFIEKIEIRLWENLGVEKRGAFYDGVGALRDIGQNHLLQMLALATMDKPLDFSSQAIQLKRAQILSKLKKLSEEEIKTNTLRFQHEGYRGIEGVAPESQIETYFKVKAEIDDPRWAGVPIFMEGGKKIEKSNKEMIISYKHDEAGCMCPSGQHYKNRIIFTLDPIESIQVEFWVRRPGLGNEIECKTLDFTLREKKTKNVEEYEKLFLDGIRGDQTLFVSTSEVKSMWAFIDPIVTAWAKNSVDLKFYKPNTIPQ